MRRLYAALAVLALAACGLDVVGALSSQQADAGPDASPGGAAQDVGEVDSADSASAAVFPTYVDAGLASTSASDLTSATAIDTTNLTINGAAPPAGVQLVATAGGAAGLAVLTVGSFTVSAELTVTGDRALVVLASGPVTVAARVRVDAQGSTKGPGGYAPAQGPGAGGAGATGGLNDNSGGGGAGHGTAGAAGGANSATAGDGGAVYDLPLVGGSGGGRGDPTSCTVLGGAGGGVVDIFSRVSITIAATGGVSANGSGGTGGCANNIGSSAAGGGSGGWILLEAPSVTVHGTLTANGGGGGGGDVYNGTGGTNGSDGRYDPVQADGGTGSQSTGGVGGSVTGGPTAGGAATNGAGGGGAVGRVLVRVRGAGFIAGGGVVSPRAAVDGGL
jgi:hypothetical protein